MISLAQLSPGDRLLTRYQLTELVAEAAHSAVYRGVDLKAQRAVAIKFDLEGRDIEAHMLRRVSSPGVIPLIDAGSLPTANNEATFCVLPWLAGQHLAQLLAAHQLSLEQSLRLAIGIASALSDLHAAGVIHCDLKPSNVWLPQLRAAHTEARGDVDAPLLIDLGSARYLDTDGPQPRLGTPGFAAPEQLRGGVITPQADLFALGALLYRCLSGEFAFPGGTPALVALASLSPAPPPCVELPPALSALLSSLLAPTSDQRPQTAERVAAELRQILAQTPSPQLTTRPLGRRPAKQEPAARDAKLPEASEHETTDWLRLRLRRRRELSGRCLELSGGRRDLLEALLAQLPDIDADFDLSASSALWSHPHLIALKQALNELEPQQLQVLRAVAELGTLKRQTLRAALGFPAETLDAAIKPLLASAWLGQGGGGYTLHAALVGCLLRPQVSEPQRRALHGAAANQLLCDERQPATPDLLARIAAHYSAANQPELAASLLYIAARQSMGQAQVSQARGYAERALGAAHTSHGALHALLAEACNSAGDPSRATHHAEQALLSQRLEPRHGWAAKRELAIAWRRRGADARLSQLAHELLAVAQAEPPADLDAISCLTRVAEELAYTAHARLALALIACLPAPNLTLHSAWRARLLDAESTRAYVVGDLVGCQRAIQSAAALYRDLGDAQGALIREVYLGWSQLELGQLARAEGTLRQARDTAQQISCWPALASAEQNLGFCLALRGDLQGGIALLLSAVQSGRAQQHRRLLVGGYELLARVQLLAGDWASAVESAQLGLAELETGAEPQRAPLFALLGQARLAAGDIDAARAALELAWSAYQAGVGLEGTEQLWVLLGRTDVLNAAGQHALATETSRAARAVVLGRLAQLTTPEDAAALERDAPECARALAAPEPFEPT